MHIARSAFAIKPDGEIYLSPISDQSGVPQILAADDRLSYQPQPVDEEWQFGASNNSDNIIIKRESVRVSQNSSAFGTELKLWLQSLDEQLSAQEAPTPHHDTPEQVGAQGFFGRLKRALRPSKIEEVEEEPEEVPAKDQWEDQKNQWAENDSGWGWPTKFPYEERPWRPVKGPDRMGSHEGRDSDRRSGDRPDSRIVERVPQLPLSGSGARLPVRRSTMSQMPQDGIGQRPTKGMKLLRYGDTTLRLPRNYRGT